MKEEEMTPEEQAECDALVEVLIELQRRIDEHSIGRENETPESALRAVIPELENDQRRLEKEAAEIEDHFNRYRDDYPQDQ